MLLHLSDDALALFVGVLLQYICNLDQGLLRQPLECRHLEKSGSTIGPNFVPTLLTVVILFVVLKPTSLRKDVYFVCFSRPDRIMIVWKLALSIAHSLQFVAALIVAVLQDHVYLYIVIPVF